MYTNLDELSPFETLTSCKSSKKEQELRQAVKQVQLQGKAVKVVAKTTGISARAIREFINDKSKESRASGKESDEFLKERYNARLSQAVAACNPVQPEGCQRMSLRDAERMFNIAKSTISQHVNDPMCGHRFPGRYYGSCVYHF
jgi:hypothetical protein